MNKLRLEKASLKVYDIQYESKTAILLKGIGRYCQAKGCTKHLFGNRKQRFCSNKCRFKVNNEKSNYERVNGLMTFINLKTMGTTKKYRLIRIYLKKGVIEEIKITPEAKELWAKLDIIENFRNIKKPLEILN